MNFLDQAATTAAFIPKSVQQYFALRLAKFLQDEPDLMWYLRQVERAGMENLLQVLRSVQAPQLADWAKRFKLAFQH